MSYRASCADESRNYLSGNVLELMPWVRGDFTHNPNAAKSELKCHGSRSGRLFPIRVF